MSFDLKTKILTFTEEDIAFILTSVDPSKDIAQYILTEAGGYEGVTVSLPQGADEALDWIVSEAFNILRGVK